MNHQKSDDFPLNSQQFLELSPVTSRFLPEVRWHFDLAKQIDLDEKKKQSVCKQVKKIRRKNPYKIRLLSTE